MGITSTVSDDGREVSIKVSGRFDFSSHNSFHQAYSQTEGEQVRYLIDMSETEYIDSAALGMLLLLRERAGGDNARIRIKGCQGDVSRILEISRFNQLFDIEAGTES